MLVQLFEPNAYSGLSLSLLDGPEPHPASAVTPGLPGPASRFPTALPILAVATVAAIAVSALRVTAFRSRRDHS